MASSINCDLFIDGQWRAASGPLLPEIVDSYTGEPFTQFKSASSMDVDIAVSAAAAAFPPWSALPLTERISYVRKIADGLRSRSVEIAAVISREVGMPVKLSKRIQADAPAAAWGMYADIAESFEWEQRLGHSVVAQAPVGVVGCITPWNYPLHQITGKIAPALLAGCTVVLKPSELAPASAAILAQVIEEAQLPKGVFNLVHGTGSLAGSALVAHPEIDMVSFTGSTRAGQHVAQVCAATTKRVALEMGGKSAAVVLRGADIPAAVKATLGSCFLNSGQTCSAITRLLVHEDSYQEVVSVIAEMLPGWRMGDPADPATRLGPLVSDAQKQKVLQMVDTARAVGAEYLASPAATPEQGFFVPPIVLGHVTPDMPIANEEVFGPVLTVMTYRDTEDAVRIANGTKYGLAATVWAQTPEQGLALARRLRAGQVDVNGAPFNPAAPFGGFKQSGIGRENGQYGLAEFLEPVSIQLPPSYVEAL